MRKTLEGARDAAGKAPLVTNTRRVLGPVPGSSQQTTAVEGKRCSANEPVYDYGLYNGRFQIVTEAHLANLRLVLGKARHAIVNIGSINQSRSTRNPFTFEERVRMWTDALTPEETNRTLFVGQQDLGNPVRWASEVEKKVSDAIRANGGDPDTADIAIFGHRKDATSLYLDDFPGYVLEETPAIDGVSASNIRDAYFAYGDALLPGEASVDAVALRRALAERLDDGGARGWLQAHMPAWCVDTLHDFMATDAYADLVIEARKAADYARSWEPAPYPVNFTTADAIVVQGNKVLLVRRRGYPGKGLWALPGGHIKPHQTVVEAALSELTEETGIDLSKTVLRHAYVDTFFMDDPWRSTRGRTITFASIFHLKPTPRGRTPEERRKSMALPHVRGLSDADRAAWKTFDEVRDMRGMLFEDHAIIIDKALERLGVR